MDAAPLLNPIFLAVSSLDPSGSPSLADYGIAGVVASVLAVPIVWLVKRLLAAKDDAATAERADHARELALVESQRESEKQRADRLEQELSRLNATTQAQTLNAQTQWLNALQDSQRAVAAAIQSLRGDR